MQKEKIHTVSKNDFIIQPFKGSGPGGQHRNKNATAIRIIHTKSGARAESQQFKSQKQNRAAAFKRLIECPEFKVWHRREIAQVLFGRAEVDRKLEDAMRPENCKVEVKCPETGRWIAAGVE